MHDYHLLNSSLMIAIALFAIGAVGLSARRNLMVMMCSAAIMLQGVSLAACSFSSFHGDWSGRSAAWIVASLATLFGLIVAAVAVSRINHRQISGVESSNSKARHD